MGGYAEFGQFGVLTTMTEGAEPYRTCFLDQDEEVDEEDVDEVEPLVAFEPELPEPDIAVVEEEEEPTVVVDPVHVEEEEDEDEEPEAIQFSFGDDDDEEERLV